MIFLSYDDAKKIIHKLKIPSSTAFFKLDKIPERIPKSPASTYKKQGTWVSWGDFLGTNTLGPNDYVFVNYDEAKIIIHKLKIKGKENFFKLGKLPKGIPKDPPNTYKKQGTWISWGDFLGTGTVAHQNKEFLSYDQAKKVIHKLKIPSRDAYTKLDKLPKGIPKDPHKKYKTEGTWISWGDYLGTGTVAQTKLVFLSVEKSKPMYKKLFKEYGLKTPIDWKQFAKTHRALLKELNLPANPTHFYNLEKAKAEKKLKKKSLRKRTEK